VAARMRPRRPTGRFARGGAGAIRQDPTAAAPRKPAQAAAAMPLRSATNTTTSRMMRVTSKSFGV
jgi:hypothetical protein